MSLVIHSTPTNPVDKTLEVVPAGLMNAIVKLPGHSGARQACRGFPGARSGEREASKKEVMFSLCPFLPAGRQGPRPSRVGGTGHLPAQETKWN